MDLSKLTLGSTPINLKAPLPLRATLADKPFSLNASGRLNPLPSQTQSTAVAPTSPSPKITKFAKMIKEKYPQYADVDDEELAKMVLEKYPVYADKLDKLDLGTTAQAEPKKSLGEQLRTMTPGNIIKGQLKGLGSTILSMGEIGSSVLEKGYNATIGKLTGKEALKGAETAKQAKESALLTPQNMGQKTGFLTEQIGEFFLPVPGGAKAKAAGYASELIGKTPVLSKLLNTGARATLEGVDVGSRAYLQTADKDDAKSAAMFGAAGSVAGDILAPVTSRLSNFVFKRNIPTTNKQRALDTAKNLNIGEAVGTTGISVSRNSLLNKLETNVNALGKTLGEAIDEAVVLNPTKVTRIEDITTRVRENINTNQIIQKRMKATPIELPKALQVVEDTLKNYDDLYKGKELTFRDLQDIKVALGDGLEKEFQRAIDAPVKAQKLTEINIRSDIKKIIEQNVNKAQDLNQKLAPLLEARKRLAAKGAYSGYLTDMLVGGVSAGSPVDILSDPAGYLKRFFLAVFLKRAATSTLSKTATATILRDIDTIVASPGFTQLLQKLFDEAVDDINDK